ncbi:hypothetical protein Poli38472_013748 [Pythium oligandrum]|uniref:Uncharacterized protein n=1 Tax=Pythium oligandrum TaxID=41045 RepID=A0A8K1CDQ6_PYTOL|nr:hypothetical protein Poli38472_013748 [Pythium oligandrum]|eukprot:TMW61285.1 hypothetical protein Poli38472_013748 [Pythium oligandrum]
MPTAHAASTFSPFSGAVPGVPSTIEGKISFWTTPGENFRYTVTTDKLESVLTLESRKSKKKWECRVDDTKLKTCGPENVALPRHVVFSYLAETLQNPQVGPHRLLFQHDETQLCLALTLVFGPMFAPTYSLPLTTLELSREDVLEAQVVELQEEVGDLRKELAELRRFVNERLAAPPAETPAKPTKARDEVKTEPSTLNAQAAEFVLNQPTVIPPPPEVYATDAAASASSYYASYQPGQGYMA